MPSRQVLMVHGWSASSKSFRSLTRFLNAHGYEPTELWLGDYISMKDDVRVADVGKRMGQVIDEMIASGKLAANFDMIVHSTGGLVAREWLTTHYRGKAETCPMKRLIMLAPANYGSKLAASGKSFLGRIFKGYDNWFQTGTAMLNDLELASPYQWELAQRDVLRAPDADSQTYYGADRVWPFVIVGTHPYTNLLRQIVNEDGADGTVRVCAANLNARGMSVDFTQSDPDKLFTKWESRLDCDVPLAVLPTRTHGSIVDPDRADSDNKESLDESGDEKAQLGQLILEALGCQSFDDYRALQSEWHKISEATADRHTNPGREASEIFHQYMQANFYVTDDQGLPVTDYFLEFFSDTTKSHTQANVYLHTKVIEAVKVNSQSAARRNVFIDRTDLMEGYYTQQLPRGTERALYLSISAAAPGPNVNYFEQEKVGAEKLIPIHVEAEEKDRWLQRNTTHFVQMIIPRMPNKDVFKLVRAAQA